MKSIFTLMAGALALSLVSFGAAAQEAPASGASGAPMTPNETKPFGDWTVRCFPVSTPSPCDMFELLANKTSGERVMSVSIAYMPTGDKHVIQIAVPLGVAIQKGLILSTDAYVSPQLHYRRCDRGGCYVEMLIDSQTIGALGASSGSAKIKIFADGGKPFEIPFSLNGFNDAHGAMQDLARKKTAKPADAAPAPAPGGTPAPAPDTTTPDAPAATTP